MTSGSRKGLSAAGRENLICKVLNANQMCIRTRGPWTAFPCVFSPTGPILIPRTQLGAWWDANDIGAPEQGLGFSLCHLEPPRAKDITPVIMTRIINTCK